MANILDRHRLTRLLLINHVLLHAGHLIHLGKALLLPLGVLSLHHRGLLLLLLVLLTQHLILAVVFHLVALSLGDHDVRVLHQHVRQLLVVHGLVHHLRLLLRQHLLLGRHVDRLLLRLRLLLLHLWHHLLGHLLLGGVRHLLLLAHSCWRLLHLGRFRLLGRFLPLAPLCVGLLPRGLLRCRLNTITHVLLKLPASADGQLVKLELNRLSVLLGRQAFLDDRDDTALLLTSQMGN